MGHMLKRFVTVYIGLIHFSTAGVYEQLLLAKGSEKEMEIVRDLSRTYPSHVYYQQRQGPGQRSLYNVLKAYSVFDRQVSTKQLVPCT